MEEQDFIVVSRREGTIKTNSDIEEIVTTMGCQCFKDRELGAVTAVVEKVDGKITKSRLNWRSDSSAKFKENQAANADALLSAVNKAVDGSGNDGELKVKVRGKI